MFKYENSNNRTYISYTFEQEDIADEMILAMISNNNMEHFAPATYSCIDNTSYVKYDITSKIAASQVFSSKVSKKVLLGFLNGIADSILEADKYMIHLKAICFDLNYIYVNVSNGETIFLCLPLDNTEEIDMLAFLRRIVSTVILDSSENMDYIGKVISYLNSSLSFSALEFKQLLNSIESKSSTVPAIQTPRVTQAPPQTVVNNMQSPQPVTANKNESMVTAAQPKVTPVKATQPVMEQNKPVANNTPHNKDAVNSALKNVGMQIPGQMAIPNQPSATTSQNKRTAAPPVQPNNEEKISLFYLLQHYNKENAERYKAQKANKKTPKPQPTENMQVPGNYAVPDAGNIMQKNVPNNNGPVYNRPNFNSQRLASIHQPTATPVSPPIQNNYSNSQNTTVTPYSAPVTSTPQVSDSFGETTVLGGGNDGETAVLSDSPVSAAKPAVRPFIIRVRNNERIEINKPIFRIEKERSYVDYFIGDNSYVSRGHANILEREGKYFIIDNNSRNHTYVNGEIITSSTEVELHSGDVFKLANEEFEFKLF